MCQRQCPRREKKKIKRRRREEKPSDHNAGLTSVKEAGKEGGLDWKSWRLQHSSKKHSVRSVGNPAPKLLIGRVPHPRNGLALVPSPCCHWPGAPTGSVAWDLMWPWIQRDSAWAITQPCSQQQEIWAAYCYGHDCPKPEQILGIARRSWGSLNFWLIRQLRLNSFASPKNDMFPLTMASHRLCCFLLAWWFQILTRGPKLHFLAVALAQGTSHWEETLCGVRSLVSPKLGHRMPNSNSPWL